MDQSKSSEQTITADEGQKAETKEKCYISMNKPLPIDGSLRSLSNESAKDGPQGHSRTGAKKAIDSLGPDAFHLQRFSSKAGDGREPYLVYWESIGLLKALVAARNKSTTYSNTGDTLADGAFEYLANELLEDDLKIAQYNFIQIKLLNNRFILRHLLKLLQNELNLRSKAVEKLVQSAPPGEIIACIVNACQAIDTSLSNIEFKPDDELSPYQKATVKDFVELYNELTAHRESSVYVQDKGHFETTFEYRKYYDPNPSKGGTTRGNRGKPNWGIIDKVYSLQTEHISNKYRKYYNPNPFESTTHKHKHRKKSNRKIVDKLYSLQPEHISKKYPSRKEQKKFKHYYQKYLLSLVTQDEQRSAGTAAIGVEILKLYTAWSDDFTSIRNEVENQLYQYIANIFYNLATADYVPYAFIGNEGATLVDKFMPEALEHIRHRILVACHDAFIALLRAYAIRRYYIKKNNPEYQPDYKNIDISGLYVISNELLEARDVLARENQDLHLGDHLSSIDPKQMVDLAEKYVKPFDGFLSFAPSQLTDCIEKIKTYRNTRIGEIMYERFICTILLLQYTCQIVAGKCIQEGLSDLEEEFKRIHKFYNYLRSE